MAKYKIKSQNKGNLPYRLSDKIGLDNYNLLNNGESTEIDSLDNKDDLAQYIDLADLDVPDSSNTKAEIQAYLDSKGISYTQAMNKTQLLELLND